MGCHPHPGQAEKILMKLEKFLLLQLLQGCPVKLPEKLDGWMLLLLLLLEDELLATPEPSPTRMASPNRNLGTLG